MYLLRSLSAISTLAISTLCLSGCGALNTWRASDHLLDVMPPEPPRLSDQPEMAEFARRFGLMALFSKVVYRNDLGDDAGKGKGCDYLKTPEGRAEPPGYGMPKDAFGEWRRWTEGADTSSPPCVDKDGLYYETYVHLDGDGAIDEAIIAFRGTENSRSQIIDDWSTNFAAAFGFQPSEYRMARSSMRGLIEALERSRDSQGRPPAIYATGHSLGGGLAQQLGYMSKSIRAVVVFNTTPVTNWSALRLDRDIQNDFPTIYRLEHGGEFLSFPRYIATTATKARYGRYDYAIQIDDRSLVAGHAIDIFACRFASLVAAAAAGATPAAHHYPKDWAKSMLNAAKSGIGPHHEVCESERHLIDKRPQTDWAIPPQPE